MLEIHSQDCYPPSLVDTESGEEWVLNGATELALAKLVLSMDARLRLLEGRLKCTDNAVRAVSARLQKHTDGT